MNVDENEIENVKNVKRTKYQEQEKRKSKVVSKIIILSLNKQ